MTISVRMDPLLERELELVAKRRGVSKSQFVIEAVERALGRRNPYELMLALKAEENRPEYQTQASAFQGEEQPYETDASRAALIEKLKAKHGIRAG
jgi:RHH-type rel operon transcriptional repressor/antitoxin RelB